MHSKDAVYWREVGTISGFLLRRLGCFVVNLHVAIEQFQVSLPKKLRVFAVLKV
jgi:hypothetical protein